MGLLVSITQSEKREADHSMIPKCYGEINKHAFECGNERQVMCHVERQVCGFLLFLFCFFFFSSNAKALSWAEAVQKQEHRLCVK